MKKYFLWSIEALLLAALVVYIVFSGREPEKGEESVTREPHIDRALSCKYSLCEISMDDDKLVLYNVPYRVVADRSFEPLTDSDVNEILDSCEKMLKSKFPVKKIIWKRLPDLSVESFIDTQRIAEGMKEDGWYRLDLADPDCLKLYYERWKAFYQRQSLEEQISFLPENERAQIKDYDDLTKYVMKKVSERLNMFKDVENDSGQTIIESGKLDYYSESNWAWAVSGQDEAFVTLTNVPIFYDNAEVPVIHAVLYSMTTSGMCVPIFEEEDISARIYTTAFNSRTEQKFFSPIPKTSRDMQNKITGMTLAHEIAHCLFLLLDNHTHPDECLMFSTLRLSRLEHTKVYLDNPGECPKCGEIISGRMNEFRGNILFSNKSLQKAEWYFWTALDGMPKNIMCPYEEWKERVYFKLNEIGRLSH